MKRKLSHSTNLPMSILDFPSMARSWRRNTRIRSNTKKKRRKKKCIVAWRAANRLIASEWCSRFLRRIYRITGNDVSESSNDFANREIKGGRRVGANERDESETERRIKGKGKKVILLFSFFSIRTHSHGSHSSNHKLLFLSKEHVYYTFFEIHFNIFNHSDFVYTVSKNYTYISNFYICWNYFENIIAKLERKYYSNFSTI